MRRSIAFAGDRSGPSRRAVLQAGLTSTIGFGLADLLRLRTLAAGPGGVKPVKVKSCIMIWLAGGPSHIDTFDPKPEATPDIRGEFKPIDTSVPGLWISEILPKLAKVMDKVTLIRSVTSPEADHVRAAQHLMTGYRPSPAIVYPNYGSVVAKFLSESRGALPPYVAAPDAPIASSSGYLTPAFDPFTVGGDPNADSFRVRDLTPPDRLTLDRLKRRRDMVKTLDGFAHDVGQTSLTSTRDQFTDKAYDLLTSTAAQSAFKMSDEPTALREAYGRNPVGQTLLLARRLVEAGVAFITVNDRGQGQLGWDTHAQNFTMLKTILAPSVDQGVSALITDLAQRGRLNETLVVMMGEFGRTPKINPNAGRDHHGRANFTLLAGGGIPGGLVIGKTDTKGDSPIDRPVTPADLAATIYTAIGVDPNFQFETPDGRPIRLVDRGQALRELATRA
jgi:hypothetical protein